MVLSKSDQPFSEPEKEWYDYSSSEEEEEVPTPSSGVPKEIPTRVLEGADGVVWMGALPDGDEEGQPEGEALGAPDGDVMPEEEYDYVPDFSASKDRQYLEWKAAWPKLLAQERRITSREFPELDQMKAGFREEFRKQVQKAGQNDRPPWMNAQECQDPRYKSNPRFICRATNKDSDYPIPSRYTYLTHNRRKIVRYSYQWSVYLDPKTRVMTMREGKLCVSHICHNHKCHKRAHLVLEPMWLNQMRQSCLAQLKKGTKNLVCQHPGVPCIRRIPDYTPPRSAFPIMDAPPELPQDGTSPPQVRRRRFLSNDEGSSNM